MCFEPGTSGTPPGDAKAPVDLEGDIPEVERDAQLTTHAYFWEHVPDYRRLYELRKKGWQSAEGDKHFEKQRETAAKPDETSLRFFYTMMQTIGKDMDQVTGVFGLSGVKMPALLDMCMAPGGFTAHALKRTPQLRVRAMTLPRESGGHEVRMLDENIKVEFLDITTLAADMGAIEKDVPTTLPQPHGLLFKKLFAEDEKFDIAICGGALVRIHQRQEWREKRESVRLSLTQLALGLEHLKPGGAMIILLHKPEMWRCFHLIHQFSKISNIQVFKHQKHHSIRSAFYFIAKKVQSNSVLAHAMIAEWKQKYRIATFGTDEEYSKIHHVTSETVEASIEEFGQRYVKMGRKIWKTQADALEKVSFIRNGLSGQPAWEGRQN